MKMLTNLVVFVCFLASALCQTTMAPTTPMPVDLETELTQRGGFTQILSLLKTAGLLDTLKNADNITLFAPTDAALARVPADQLAALTSNPSDLQKLLGFHALLEDVKALHRKGIGRLQDKVIMSSNGLPIRINVYRLLHTVAAEGVNITERGIRVSNGYVHALDGVMIPPEGDVVEIAVANGKLTSLVSLLSAAGLVDAIKSDMNITVFAPHDAAFAKVDPKVTAYLTSHPEDLKSTCSWVHLKKKWFLS
ncbi:transforming growth factor-beta-induced protein ig-h3 [Elysia marginata]|uniref:Transforming growth factor-beta-induced protein ig-h3 n=1 Tax=Elysia marginata TaxID=1093978 RepID=A0AAV4H6L9_9GAST|nr:transforming growth factor-beta-induced protein ig-h3 [Elysia marginata]